MSLSEKSCTLINKVRVSIVLFSRESQNLYGKIAIADRYLHPSLKTHSRQARLSPLVVSEMPGALRDLLKCVQKGNENKAGGGAWVAGCACMHVCRGARRAVQRKQDIVEHGATDSSSSILPLCVHRQPDNKQVANPPFTNNKPWKRPPGSSILLVFLPLFDLRHHFRKWRFIFLHMM